MIKSRSPHYITVPFLSPLTGAKCTKYILKIKTWRGSLGSQPQGYDYEMVRFNYNDSSGSEDVNISSILSSFIESKLTLLSDGINNQDEQNQIWTSIDIEYFTNNSNDDGVNQNKKIDSVVLGYAFGSEGKNKSNPVDLILTNGRVFKVGNGCKFTIGLITVSKDFDVSITSTPTNQYQRIYNVPSIADTEGTFVLLTIDTSLLTDDNRINVDIEGTKFLLMVDNSKKNINNDVYFINQHGAQQTISMNKQRTESINVSSKEYERYAGQPSDGYHQFKTFLSNGISSVVLNSGYLSEGQNTSFKELLLSESIWIEYEGKVLPATIKTSSLSYKTVANDSLINYEIEFKYAYNEINNV